MPIGRTGGEGEGAPPKITRGGGRGRGGRRPPCVSRRAAAPGTQTSKGRKRGTTEKGPGEGPLLCVRGQPASDSGSGSAGGEIRERSRSRAASIRAPGSAGGSGSA